ncbi:MAG: hypothetical protein IKE18_02150 [Oscillospiraceae bacterium]|nr:hypothetical protein [Oscillospiraceae bacterium]
MSRKVTSEERNILLENPELVMFDPYRAVKSHTVSLGKALIAPTVTGVILLVWALLCPEFMNAHPKLFAGIGCAALVIACGSVPVLYLVLDTRTYRNAKEQHYARQLRQLLPEDLECSIAHVLSVTVQKGEGSWIMDGREEMFGYSSYVNYFSIAPDTDLAVITDNRAFWAFVKRDGKTESLYQN